MQSEDWFGILNSLKRPWKVKMWVFVRVFSVLVVRQQRCLLSPLVRANPIIQRSRSIRHLEVPSVRIIKEIKNGIWLRLLQHGVKQNRVKITMAVTQQIVLGLHTSSK